MTNLVIMDKPIREFEGLYCLNDLQGLDDLKIVPINE